MPSCYEHYHRKNETNIFRMDSVSYVINQDICLVIAQCDQANQRAEDFIKRRESMENEEGKAHDHLVIYKLPLEKRRMMTMNGVTKTAKRTLLQMAKTVHLRQKPSER